MALVLDLADPQELQGYARGILEEEDRNRFRLSAYLPNENIDEIEWRVTGSDFRLPDAAKVRAWDTEAPIGSRQGLRRLMGELPPISKKMRLGEEERLRKRALERGNNQGIIDAIFDDVRNLTLSVASRVEMMRGEVLQTGKIVFAENGVDTTVDFGRKAGHTTTAAIKWDQPATATPIANLRSLVQTYIDTNGVSPAYVLTSTQVITNLLLNAEVRALATQVSGVPAIVTVQTLQTILQAFGLPPFVPYDTNVRVDGVQRPVLDPKKITLMPPASEPLGATFYGTTAEALELQEARAIGNEDAPGLTATTHKLDDPVSIWNKVAAIAMPTLPNPDLTLTATVLT
jgi:hypothetical protein